MNNIFEWCGFNAGSRILFAPPPATNVTGARGPELRDAGQSRGFTPEAKIGFLSLTLKNV
jgi:hypothetical protein